MKILYKKDSKGKIRVWQAYTITDALIQESGINGGKLVKHCKVCLPKNVGKSNETTGAEQAYSELKSLVNSKLSEGYFESESDAESELVILPMLANDYKKFSHKIDWDNCWVQPKLDGMRCLALCNDGDVRLMSRDGKTIENMDHIIESLKMIKGYCVLDGELYSHGRTFQENMKLIKKYVPNYTEGIQYHVYDLVCAEDKFRSRNGELQVLTNGISNIEIVDTYMVGCEADVMHYHNIFLSEDYEGTMIRHGVKGYEIDKRSQSLLKLKDFIDIDAEIIDVLPNDANPLHGTPLLKYNKSTFKAGVKMSHTDREDLLANKDKYIGKLANIRFFEWTDDGNPRFPVMTGIHLDRK